MNKIRLGRVEVAHTVLEEYPDFIEKYIPEWEIHFVIPKDEYTDIYYGVHPEFDEIDTETERTPFYILYFRRDEDGVIHKHSIEKDLLAEDTVN